MSDYNSLMRRATDLQMVTILEVMLTKSACDAMLAATKDGRPAIVGMTRQLELGFGKEFFTKARRQFLGVIAKHVMESLGYYAIQQGVRTPKDPLITVGTCYGKSERSDDPIIGLCKSLVSGLSVQHKRILLDVLVADLGR